MMSSECTHAHNVVKAPNEIAKLLSAAAVEMTRDSMSLPPALSMSPADQINAFCEYVLHGAEGNFDARELAYIERVKAGAL